MVAPPGNQAENGENKPQPVASGETGLLDSIQQGRPAKPGSARFLCGVKRAAGRLKKDAAI